jgi:hypothetical protein
MTGAHLSFLALDGLRLGRAPEAGERAHLAGCADCAGYLQAGAGAAAPAVPAWLSRAALPGSPAGNASARAQRARPMLRPWQWLLAFAPTAGAAALWLLVVRPQPPARPTTQSPAPALSPLDGVREKGTPVVHLYVKRDALVFAWDGKQPVRPGDRLQLDVRRAGFRFVSVAALPRSDQPPQLLYQGALDAGRPLLPVSFRVDDRGTEEVLSVILGRDPVPAELHALAGPPEGEAGTWRQILMLEKRSGSQK